MKKVTEKPFEGMVVGLFFLLYTLMVHAKVLPTLPIEEEIYGIQSITELFHQFKSQILIVIAVALVLGVIMSVLTGELRLRGDRYFLGLVAGYGLLSLASYLGAAYKDLAWRGGIDRYEGLPVLLSYAVVAACFYFMTTESKARIWFLRFFSINNSLIYTMGLLQTAGFNLLNQPWFLKLVIWPAQDVVVEEAGLSATRAAYATFGNQNFMGSYAVLSIPLNLYMASRAETKREKVLWVGLSLLGLTTLLCSYSLAGLVGFAVILPVLALLIEKGESLIADLKQWGLMIAVPPMGYAALVPYRDWKLVIFYIGAWLFAVLLLMLYRSLKTRDIRIDYKLTVRALIITGVLSVIVVLMVVFSSPRIPLPLSAVSVSDQRATVVMYGEQIDIGYDAGTLKITRPAEGKTLTLAADEEAALETADGKVIRAKFFKDSKTQGIYGLVFEKPYLVFMMGTYQDRPVFTLVGNGSRPIEPQTPKRIPMLDGLEKIGSGRGYILSRTLALVPDYLLSGSGPDHFPTVFPQRDVTGKSGISNPYLIIDKPHNWYLQMAINTGLISMLCVAGAILMLVHKALKSVFSRQPLTSEMAVLLTLACIGYAVTGLFNDSVVSVAPVFWTMLGSAHGLFDRSN